MPLNRKRPQLDQAGNTPVFFIREVVEMKNQRAGSPVIFLITIAALMMVFAVNLPRPLGTRISRKVSSRESRIFSGCFELFRLYSSVAHTGRLESLPSPRL